MIISNCKYYHDLIFQILLDIHPLNPASSLPCSA